jgi:hypothetical protein
MVDRPSDFEALLDSPGELARAEDDEKLSEVGVTTEYKQPTERRETSTRRPTRRGTKPFWWADFNMD